MQNRGGAMKIITVANRKGGTGKTTTAFNLAHSYASQNYKVCLLDLDGQGNLSDICRTHFLSVDDFLKAKISTVTNNLDIIAACGDFRYLEKMINDEFSPTTFLKTEMLPRIEGYDYLIIDTSPSNNIINSNGYLISDTFLLVMLLDRFSVKGISAMTEVFAQIKKINTTIECKIVVNQYRKNRNLNKKIEPFLGELREDMFTNIFIPDRQIIRDNILSCKSSIAEIEQYRQLSEVLRVS